MKTFILLLSILFSGAAFAEVAVIVHPSNANALGDSDISRIFLGKSKTFADGGQAVPIMTRGIVLYSGSQLITDNPALGASLYSDNAGELTTTSGGGNIVGTALGRKDDNGHVLVRINL